MRQHNEVLKGLGPRSMVSSLCRGRSAALGFIDLFEKDLVDGSGKDLKPSKKKKRQ